ncbi:hypothetical protein QNI16_17355 [Cytophagaceae bacterium YF14B1]|uniref:Transposase IS200-like domain-containing protein n=1 Tax=Xanthocytophaga flava TaxID=3048013 RepID=A0AAE3QS89_9BACT|nr:transposase [Xanthocytophaga flavus]MDJ1482276.1 hypothetical protein [Xanthocytophaga flavus]
MSLYFYFHPDLHHRRSIRLNGYDYSQAGLYFITICTHERQCVFGEVITGEMVLNPLGDIAYRVWHTLPERFPTISLDAFIVMPNHIHAILVLNETIPHENVGAGLAPAQPDEVPSTPISEHTDGNGRAGASPAPTVSAVIGTYKSLVYKECLAILNPETKL